MKNKVQIKNCTTEQTISLHARIRALRALIDSIDLQAAKVDSKKILTIDLLSLLADKVKDEASKDVSKTFPATV